MIRKGGQEKQAGFTIIELIIATSVFGIIMLVATTGIIYLGRTYYKGIITSKTQSAGRSIVQDISNTFQFNPATITNPSAITNGDGVVITAQCIGNYRFNYVIDAVVGPRYAADAATRTTRHALWLDIISEGATCAPMDITNSVVPSDSNTSTLSSAISQRRELVPTSMRLREFRLVQPMGATFLNIDMKLIYGDLDLSPAPDYVCAANRVGGQFCAVTTQSTSIKKRL